MVRGEGEGWGSEELQSSGDDSERGRRRDQQTARRGSGIERRRG